MRVPRECRDARFLFWQSPRVARKGAPTLCHLDLSLFDWACTLHRYGPDAVAWNELLLYTLQRKIIS